MQKKSVFSFLLLISIQFLILIKSVFAQGYGYFSGFRNFPLFYGGFYSNPIDFYRQFPFWIDAFIIIYLLVMVCKAASSKIEALGDYKEQVGGLFGFAGGLYLSMYLNNVGYSLLNLGPILLIAIVFIALLGIYNWIKGTEQRPGAGFLVSGAILLLTLLILFPEFVRDFLGFDLYSFLVTLAIIIAILALLTYIIPKFSSSSSNNTSSRGPGTLRRFGRRLWDSLFGRGDDENPPGGGGNSGGDGGSSPRKPGPIPKPTPKKTNPKDPPTNTKDVPPGVSPSSEELPKAPQEPQKPKIPDEKKIFIDLSPHFNGIRSQDGLGACTAFAATSIFEYILKRIYKGDKEYLSPLFLWYKTRDVLGAVNVNTGPPTCLIPMLNLIRDGVCFEKLWSFEGNSSDKWKTSPNENAEVDALNKKIIEINSVNKEDPDQWVHQLMNDNPLNIAVLLPKEFTSGDYKGKFYSNFNPELSSGGHAMVIVGYHSHYPYEGTGIKAFKIRNSWGINWGENGYVWIPAEILKKMLIEDPIIIKGWKKSKSEEYEIIGRAVYDFKNLSMEDSGAKLFGDNKLETPTHNFKVGVIGQIKGHLQPIGEEVIVYP